jgi:hypothetical protein
MLSQHDTVHARDFTAQTSKHGTIARHDYHPVRGNGLEEGRNVKKVAKEIHDAATGGGSDVGVGNRDGLGWHATRSWMASRSGVSCI